MMKVRKGGGLMAVSMVRRAIYYFKIREARVSNRSDLANEKSPG